MRHLCIRGGLAGLIIGLLFASAFVQADIKDNLTYQGNKARITIGKIKAKADHCTYDMAAAVGEMLSTALTNTDKFIVLASQEEVEELVDEIDLAQSGYVEDGRGPEKGLMEGADLLVTGAVTAFEPDAGGGGGALGGLQKKAFGKIGVKKKSAKIIMDIKLIDIRTRRILKATSIEAKSSKWKADMGGGGWTEDIALAGGLGVYSNEPMEKAIRAMLAKTVEKIVKETPDEYYRYQGKGQYTTDYGGDQKTGDAAPAPTGSTPAATATSTTTPAAPPAAPAAEDMTLYTKYDFIPGNRVIYYDDMKNEEEGEFPFRWSLDKGVYEVARLNKEYWILATDDGFIRPKIPAGQFPDQYTVEMEFYHTDPKKGGNYYYIHWMDASDSKIAEFGTVGQDTWLVVGGKTISNKGLPVKLTRGVHIMRIMATNRSLKCYIDNERVANVPKIENFNPVAFRLYLRPYRDQKNPTLFRGFRFAEGGKTMREQLDETGKIVTHGILFDQDSYVIKAESFRTLKNIGRVLEDDPDLRLSIEGHTDSDGGDEHNKTLSQNRANSVRDYLISKYSIAAERLESKGWGEANPLDNNTSPEGKANNRRVELIKL